jgi:hypothetical protein
MPVFGRKVRAHQPPNKSGERMRPHFIVAYSQTYAKEILNANVIFISGG